MPAPATPCITSSISPRLRDSLEERGLECVMLHSAASDRPIYLQRPDKGRRLDADLRACLEARPRGHRSHTMWYS